MQDPVTELVQRGRLLPPEARERVVAGLLESLNQPASAALDPAWELEIEKRLAEYDRGEAQAMDAEIVFAKARKLLASRRFVARPLLKRCTPHERQKTL